MARYNEIQVGRFNRYLQKLLSMKGEVPAPQLGAEIQTTLQAEEMGVENRYLLAWDRFGNVLDSPAVALNQSGVRMRNPSGSNVMFVLEKVLATSTAATQLPSYLGAQIADLASAGVAGGRLDARGRAAHSAIFSTQNNAVTVPTFGSQIHQGRLSASTLMYDFVLDDHQEITLLPGDSFQVVCQQVNQQLTVTFIWRERFLEDSERA